MISLEHVFAWQLQISGFKIRDTQIEGCQIRHYEMRCPKPRGTLLFLHGIGASSVHYAKIMSRLHSFGYDVYAVDLPGHGLSSNSFECNADSFFKVFEAWASKFLSSDFILIGNSLGGAVALRYALENPQRLSKLILISPAGGFAHEEDWNGFKKTLIFESIQDSKRFVPKIYHKAPWYLPLFYVPFLRTMRRKTIRQLIEQTQFEDFQKDPKLYLHLPPTWIIWGKSEKLFPTAHLSRFREVLPPHVIFEEPDGVGHCPQLDNPDWLIRRLEEISRD